MNRLLSYLLLIMGLLLTFNSVWAYDEDAAAAINYYCHQPDLKCIKVGRGQTWQRMFPDPRMRELVMRLNRNNTQLKKLQTLIVPRDPNVDYLQLAPFPAHQNTNGHKMIVISLPLYAFAVYNKEGNLIHWGPASGGRTWCGNSVDDGSCETQTGDYKIFRVSGEDCVSKTYPVETNGGSPMPWCMFYFKGAALHGSNLSGFEHLSHGCVRLFDEDAQWLNLHFASIGTRVVIVK